MDEIIFGKNVVHNEKRNYKEFGGTSMFNKKKVRT